MSSLQDVQAAAIASMTDYFKQQADTLSLDDVDGMDAFNKRIQFAIESCATPAIQTALAVIKYQANQKFDENRRAKA